MFRAARLEPRAGATHGGLRIVLLHLIALGSGALGLLGEHAMEGALVWLALWAPAMGAAGRGLELRWHGLLPTATGVSAAMSMLWEAIAKGPDPDDTEASPMAMPMMLLR